MKYTLKLVIVTLCFFCCLSAKAQVDRWQQAVKYEMNIDFDAKTHQYQGIQKCSYTNNSPDTLNRVFYHLYFNAFQPESMMDVRSQTILDPDRRVGNRIGELKENEIGFQKVKSLSKDGKAVKFEMVGTILEVDLRDPILPGQTAVFDMEYTCQVPVQIRRSGRDNKEGVDYSMSQWYPKMAEYDYQGWHANPYVGREFYGIWGDFDVTININEDYTVGGTGELTEKAKNIKGNKKQWHFMAKDVHDFVWAADPDYTYETYKAYNGTLFEMIYIPGEKTTENWKMLGPVMDEVLQYADKHYGKYPYPKYAIIQGGDGGMEYPMATLVTGERSFASLVGVSVHELMHSWYQMVLGTNESLYPWMDEGFTSFASAEIMNHLRSKGLISGETTDNPHYYSVRGYCRFSQSGYEEPLSTHSDHYSTNQAYGVASYTKGTVFLQQLNYIMGDKAFRKGMLDYYNQWKFKHPNDNDFVRVMERASDLELDWFKEYFVNSTKTIDYSVDTIYAENRKTTVALSKIGEMPMPMDVEVKLKNGESVIYHIPLRLMRGHKTDEGLAKVYNVMEDWPWTHPTYRLSVAHGINEIETVTIDASQRLADIDIDNNVYPRVIKEEEIEEEK